jgi:hypothetical protein
MAPSDMAPHSWPTLAIHGAAMVTGFASIVAIITLQVGISDLASRLSGRREKNRWWDEDPGGRTPARHLHGRHAIGLRPSLSTAFTVGRTMTGAVDSTRS